MRVQYTERARKVMALANQEAERFGHEKVDTQHILLGLVKEGSGIGATVIKSLDVDLRKIRSETEKRMEAGPEIITRGKLPHTPQAKKVGEYAIEEARNLNHNYVGTEHLLLGLLRGSEGVAAQMLQDLGLELKEVREKIVELIEEAGSTQNKASSNKAAANAENEGSASGADGSEEDFEHSALRHCFCRFIEKHARRATHLQLEQGEGHVLLASEDDCERIMRDAWDDMTKALEDFGAFPELALENKPTTKLRQLVATVHILERRSSDDTAA